MIGLIAKEYDLTFSIKNSQHIGLSIFEFEHIKELKHLNSRISD